MSLMLKRLRRNLAYEAVRLLAWAARALPRPAALGIFECAGRAFFHLGLDRISRDRTIANLRSAFGDSKSEGEIRSMAVAVYGTLARSAADVIRIPCLTREGVDRIVESRGLEKLDSAMAQGRGVIGVTAHIGNWELLAAYLALRGYPVSAVSRSMYDPRLDEFLLRSRRAAGVKTIARGESVRALVGALRSGRLLGILMDQHTGVRGVYIGFLGHAAYTPVGPAALALATGAPLVPMAIHWRDRLRYVVEVRDPVSIERSGNAEQDTRTITEKLNRELGEFILAHPTQWVWMHDRWKRQRDD